jgi:hypothetical protein
VTVGPVDTPEKGTLKENWELHEYNFIFILSYSEYGRNPNLMLSFFPSWLFVI